MKENSVFFFYPLYVKYFGGAVAPWLAGSTPDRAVRARVLAFNIVLCSLRHILLSQCLFPHVPPRCKNVFQQI